ncbi:hypothetical protein ACFL23_03840 [Patescibacteria group bacterium]
MNTKDKISKIVSIVCLVFVITLGLISILATGGNNETETDDEVKEVANNSSETGTQSIRVKIVDDDTYNPISEVDVVLGDSSSKLITTGKTDVNGIITFTNAPANATITAAYGNQLQSIIGVNVSNVTIDLDVFEAEVGNVNVTIINAPDNLDYWEINPGSNYESISSTITTANTTIEDYDLQRDGKLTLVVYGYDQTDNLICYGTAPSISLYDDNVYDLQKDGGLTRGVSGYYLDQTIDISKTDFSQITVTVKNIPIASTDLWMTSWFFIQETDYHYTYKTHFTTPIDSTIVETFKFIPEHELGEVGYSIGAEIRFKNGEEQWISKSISTLSNFDIDVSNAPPLAKDVLIIDASSDTPTISWSGGTTIADVTIIYMSNYLLKIYIPANKTNFIFPELPDTLSSYRPNNWEYIDCCIYYGDLSFINGWGDYLNFLNNLYSGQYTSPNESMHSTSYHFFNYSDDQQTDINLDLTASATVLCCYVAGQTAVQIPVMIQRSGGDITAGTYVNGGLYWSTNHTWDTSDTVLWLSKNYPPDFPNDTLNSRGYIHI